MAIEVSRRNNPSQTYTASGNTFYVALGTRNFVDGFQRDIISVRWGPTELTKASTYQVCNATDNTWFWWPGDSNTLYVRLAGAVNPNTGILLARFKMYWSNYPVEYNGRFYDPRLLLSPEDVNVRLAVEGVSMQASPVAAGKFTLANGDGFVDLLLNNFVIVAQQINQYEYFSTGTVIARGISPRVGTITRGDSAVEFGLWN